MMLRLFFIVFLIVPGNLIAQKNEIIPGTPEAATLAKFINFPVGYKTGVPEISIPLHTVKAGQLTLPIALSYHAGGFKINAHSGSTGLGWALSTDLQISRAVNGRDDFKSIYGYYYNDRGPYSEGSSPITLYEAQQVVNNVFDWQPDQYQYSLLGKSGTFYIQKHEGGVAPTAVTVPTTAYELK